MAWALHDFSNDEVCSLVAGQSQEFGEEVIGSGGWVGILEDDDGGEQSVTCTYTFSVAFTGEEEVTPIVEFHSVWVGDRRGSDSLLYDNGLVDRVLNRIFAIEVAVAGHPEAEAALRMQALKWSLRKDEETLHEILGSEEA